MSAPIILHAHLTRKVLNRRPASTRSLSSHMSDSHGDCATRNLAMTRGKLGSVHRDLGEYQGSAAGKGGSPRSRAALPTVAAVAPAPPAPQRLISRSSNPPGAAVVRDVFGNVQSPRLGRTGSSTGSGSDAWDSPRKRRTRHVFLAAAALAGSSSMARSRSVQAGDFMKAQPKVWAAAQAPETPREAATRRQQGTKFDFRRYNSERRVSRLADSVAVVIAHHDGKSTKMLLRRGLDANSSTPKDPVRFACFFAPFFPSVCSHFRSRPLDRSSSSSARRLT